MAVTTSIGPQYVQYSDASSNLDNCIGGGEDYRTLNASTKNIYGGVLAIRGWYGDNISDACKITNIKMYAKLRTRTTYNGATGLRSDCDFEIMTTYGSDGISGNKIAGTLWGHTWKKFGKTISESDNWQTVSEECDVPKDTRANHLLPSVRLIFWNGNALSKVRCYVKNVTITATRTRACYITFKGDGITEKTTMYDYESIPVYGATGEEKPTREGYTFKGWNNGSTTYPHGLPTTGEVDVTYTAVWEKNKYTLTVNAGTGGTVSGGGTYEHGTSATITATPNSGYKFVKWSDGNTSAARTITVTGNATYTAVFEKIIVPPEIISAAITYGGAQVSAQNKVPAGEGYLIAVGIQ